MYISSDVANKIKQIAKIKKVTVKKVLEDCELNKDTISSMSYRGSWIKTDTIAKIADYLDCSVDYLLGRTSNPDAHRGEELDKEIEKKRSLPDATDL